MSKSGSSSWLLSKKDLHYERGRHGQLPYIRAKCVVPALMSRAPCASATTCSLPTFSSISHHSDTIQHHSSISFRKPNITTIRKSVSCETKSLPQLPASTDAHPHTISAGDRGGRSNITNEGPSDQRSSSNPDKLPGTMNATREDRGETDGAEVAELQKYRSKSQPTLVPVPL